MAWGMRIGLRTIAMRSGGGAPAPPAPTHGWFGGGWESTHLSNVVDRITLADDTTNALDRCDLTVGRECLAAFTDKTHGWFGGGYYPDTDVVDRITLADDTVNALDRCDLTVGRGFLAAFTDNTYGWFGGGYGAGDYSDVVDRITLANDTVNALDRCNLSERSDAHAGFTGSA